MKNYTRAKRYITILANHLRDLGHDPIKCNTVSRYVEVGDSKIRISDHISFHPEMVHVIVSSYTTEIIIVCNNQPTVYHSIKEVKNFLTNFVFYQETCGHSKQNKDTRIAELKSALDKTQNALNEAKKDVAQVDTYKQQIENLQRDIAGKTGRITVLEQQLKVSGKTINPVGAVVLDPSNLNTKGKKKFDNCIKPIFGVLNNKEYQK